MWPTASTAFSQPQPCIAAVHCGKVISMKDCGLWATMTCKLSWNFFPCTFSTSLCLRLCGEGVVTGALKCSPSDQQLRGVSREEGREMWVFPWPTVCLWKCVCVCVCEGWQGETSDWLLSSMSITVLLLFVPSAVRSSWACFHSVWSAAEPCGVLLLTNQTSQCHWAALSKTHGHVSSLHSPAFQRLAGSRAKGL